MNPQPRPPEPALPDSRRPGLSPPAAAISRIVGDAALALAWRVLQARAEGPFTVPAPAVAVERLYYTSDDGWQCPLFLLPARPGTSGEPILLAHGLGGTHRDFALEPARCLASTLAAAGFSVYLFEHRADRSALPPADPRPFCIDDLATRDLDAALAAVAAHSAFRRVLVIGHGLGAQLLYLRLALQGDDDLAGIVTIGGAVHFEVPASAARVAGSVAALLPANWVLPGRRLQQFASPFVVSGEDVASPGTDGAVARARLRHAAGDLHGGVLRQMARWANTGHLTDATGRIDVTRALRPLPALILEPDADPACPPGAAEPAAAPLEAFFRRLEGGWGHLDPLIGTHAGAEVHADVVQFCEAWRRRCW